MPVFTFGNIRIRRRAYVIVLAPRTRAVVQCTLDVRTKRHHSPARVDTGTSGPITLRQLGRTVPLQATARSPPKTNPTTTTSADSVTEGAVCNVR